MCADNNFSLLLKRVNTDRYKDTVLDIKLIFAQYNPNRFKFWGSLCDVKASDKLNMSYSPHYKLLKQYIENNNKLPDDISITDYYKLQKLYGRNSVWIIKKINSFIWLFNTIKDNGYDGSVVIVPKPIVPNVYNNGFEIFEGHHRVACCIALDLKEISCRVVI